MIDSPRGQRIKKSLVEGEDAEVLLSYFKGELEKIEAENAGIAQCRNIITQLEEFEKELDGYDIDVTSISEMLANKKSGYRMRLTDLETTAKGCRSQLDIFDARKKALEGSSGAMWFFEALSVAAAAGGGAGSYFAFTAAESDPSSADMMNMLGYAGIGAAAAGLLSAALIPAGIDNNAKEIAELDSRMKRLGAALAQLEATRAMERPFVISYDDLMLVKRDISIGENFGTAVIRTFPESDAVVELENLDGDWIEISTGTIEYIPEGFWTLTARAEVQGRELEGSKQIEISRSSSAYATVDLGPTDTQKLVDRYGSKLSAGAAMIRF